MRGFSPFNKGIKKEASFEEEINKKEITKGKKLTRSEIEDLYSQLNPNNPDKD